MKNNQFKLLSVLVFLVIPPLFADDNDDGFEEYLDTLCNTNPFDPIFQGWNAGDFAELNATCLTYLPSGGVVSSGTYQSSSNIGSTGAQGQTSDSTAKQQVESIRDRLADIETEEAEIEKGGWGLLLAAQLGESDREDTDNESGYESDLAGIVIGGDYRFNDALVVGGALGNTTDDAEFDNDTGELKTTSLTATGYFTYVPNERFYIDGYLGFGALDYEMERTVDFDGNAANNVNVDGTTTADFDGDQFLAGFSLGFLYSFGDLNVSPYFAVDTIKTEIDAYEEEGNTNLEFRYDDQKSRSQQETLGVNISRSFTRGWGYLTPSFDLALVHESKNDSREFEAVLVFFPEGSPTPGFVVVSDDPDREFGILRLALTAEMSNGTQYFASYEQNFSNDLIETWAINLGVLMEL